jgi:hypothetical protein
MYSCIIVEPQMHNLPTADTSIPAQSPISFHHGGPPVAVLELCQLLPQALTTCRALPTSTIRLEGSGMSAPLLLVVDMEYDSTSGRGCVYLRIGQRIKEIYTHLFGTSIHNLT